MVFIMKSKDNFIIKNIALVVNNVFPPWLLIKTKIFIDFEK